MALSTQSELIRIRLQKNPGTPPTSSVSTGHTNTAWELTMTLVEKMWTLMDESYAVLNHLRTEGWSDNDPSVAKLVGQLRGMAIITALFMSPHFRDADEVAREVVLRKQKRDAGETYDTPGLGSRRYEMPRYEPSPEHKETQTQRNSIQELNERAAAYASRKAAGPKKVTATAEIPAVMVDVETRTAILELADVAEAADIAQIYGLSVASVETILAKV